MKTKIFAIVALMTMAMTASAQQYDPEFEKSLQAAKFNHDIVKKQKQPHQDMIQIVDGNDAEPTTLYSVDNHGWYLDGYAQLGVFAGNATFGGGAGIGYRGRHWGSDIHLGYRRAKEDVESDRTASFDQLQVGLRLHYNVLEWNNHHDKISIFGEYSFQLSSFLDEDNKTWSATGPDGVVTTNSVANFDNRQFTSGVKGGFEYEHAVKFSPISFILGAGYGIQQNIVLNSNKFYGQGEVYAGIRFRINRHESYNDRALQHYGMTRADVWAK